MSMRAWVEGEEESWNESYMETKGWWKLQGQVDNSPAGASPVAPPLVFQEAKCSGSSQWLARAKLTVPPTAVKTKQNGDAFPT